MAEYEQIILPKTQEFILLLLSAVTSINTREPVPLAAIHAHAMTLPPPRFTDEVVCFRYDRLGLGDWELVLSCRTVNEKWAGSKGLYLMHSLNLSKGAERQVEKKVSTVDE